MSRSFNVVRISFGVLCTCLWLVGCNDAGKSSQNQEVPAKEVSTSNKTDVTPKSEAPEANDTKVQEVRPDTPVTREVVADDEIDAKGEVVKKVSLEVRPDQETFQGTWQIQSMVISGQIAPAKVCKDATVVVEGNRWILKAQGETFEICKMVIDPKQEIKSIDLTILDTNGNVLYLEDEKKKKVEWVRMGIYKIESEKVLHICISDVVGVPRPVHFDAPTDSGLTYMTLTRIKS